MQTTLSSQYAGDDSTATDTGGIDHAAGLLLNEAFVSAIKQNEAYYVARHGGARYTSPLFRFVQCLKSHADLRGLAANEAFQRITDECHPNWGGLFPHVQLPSLEFITAWEQVHFPAGVSPWDVVRERVTNEPLTLLDKPTCEGYEHYLGIGFHVQRLEPRRDIMLPVKPMSGLLTELMGKDVSEQSVSGYCRLAMASGYLARTARAHHPSGKAARYRFDLTRFTEAGVEMEHRATTEDSAHGFSHGCHGIEGNEGTQGIHGSPGIEERRSRGGLSPAVGEHGNIRSTKQGEDTARNAADDLTITPTAIDCTTLVRDAFPDVTGPLGTAGVSRARSLYSSDADFRFALTHGIDRSGIHKWSHVIYRLKQSAPGIAGKRILWEEEEERMAKREAKRKEEHAKQREEDALRKDEEAVKRAEELAEFNSLRRRFGAPLALAPPHSPEGADVETLKAVAHSIWLDEEYGKAFREDMEYGNCGVINALRNDLKFDVAPHRSELLEHLLSLRVAVCDLVEPVDPGGHSQAAN